MTFVTRIAIATLLWSPSMRAYKERILKPNVILDSLLAKVV